MEHAPIIPALGSAALSPEMLDTLAIQGLREMAHAPIAKVARALAHFDREQLGIAIEIMVAMLDVADGDPEAEPGNDAEDDFELSHVALHLAKGPGCEVGDSPGDAAWIEWTALQPARKGTYNMVGAPNEDDEEDDDSGQRDEDGVNTGGPPTFGWGGAQGAGCPISDEGGDWASEDQPGGYMPSSFMSNGAGCPISDPGGSDQGH